MKKLSGLSLEEVAARREAGQSASMAEPITKSKSKIIKENVFTLFNLLNFMIAILLFAVGAYSNMLFIAIIILNIVIGITQELKAKKLVDELSILNRPYIKVRREDKEEEIELSEVVKDDLMVLESGNQICNDSIVVDGFLEVNESLLTGESDAVLKGEGCPLYSGSSVISGKAYAKVTHVGNENYATKLANEVKKEKKVQSELLNSMRKVTRFTSLLIVPLGILLFLEAMFLRHTPVADSVIFSSAALLGMLPKGLVLLISVSLANGVIRLSKMKILVQNIYSLETLAHVDVLCLDKTGTITDGKLKVHTVIPMSKLPKEEMIGLMQSYLAVSDDNNATFMALKKAFGVKENHQPSGKISFSSKRKWGCVSFENAGTIFLGAPERIFKEVQKKEVSEKLKQELEKGYRVLAAGYYGGEWENAEELPKQMKPLFLITLEDNLRPKTKETLEFFYKEGVDVKVISGDHVKTVSMIAKRAGLKRWADAIDLSIQGEDINYDEICEKYAVFARVTPKQKKELVLALKRKDHKIAMTGDGVNDLLALREADCSIAVADGSDASRQISQIVLMDSDFTNLPQVVMEGRKVVNNVTRTAGVFFIKTIYSVLVSVLCLIANIPFPFIPIQITLVDACIEAYPSFISIIESDTRKLKGSFLKTALGNALPFGLAVTAIILYTSVKTPFTAVQCQTVMYLGLILISMSAVIKSCYPFNKLRSFICVTMVAGTALALAILPHLFKITAVTTEMGIYLLGSVFVSTVLIFYIIGLQKKIKLFYLG